MYNHGEHHDRAQQRKRDHFKAAYVLKLDDKITLKTRKKLASVIECRLSKLTERQGKYWLKHSNFIPAAIGDLTKVVVLERE